MAAISDKIVIVDVICQHSRDGTIIPMRIRVADEDGVFNTYNIKGYKELTTNGEYKMPNGVRVSNHLRHFECKIVVFGVEKRIYLFYNARECSWRMTY